MQNRLKWLRFAIWCCLLTCLPSCTKKPPNVPVCEELSQRVVTDSATGHIIIIPSPTCEEKIGEPTCGHCVYSVDGKEIFIGEAPEHNLNGKTWGQLKSQSVLCAAVECYAPLAEYIIDACHQAGCDKTAAAYTAKINQLKTTAK